MRTWIARSSVLTPVKAGMLALALLSAGPARANDGVAGIETGELVILKSNAVSMLDEQLYLSPSEIRVHYRFRNETDRPVTTLVAFPLPGIDLGGEGDLGFTEAHRDPENPLNFRLWVDGEERRFDTHVSALARDGRDVTALLAQWGIPPLPLTPDEASWQRWQEQIARLTPAALDELKAAGAAIDADWAEGFMPDWTASLAYSWPMTFPPGQVVEVAHSYNPVPDAFIFGTYDLQAGYLNDEVCMDAGFIAAVKRRFAASETEVTTARELRYILTTANSWAGPIGRFHLIVDKEDPQALVSLCRDGIERTSATTFEWEAANWRPGRDLAILFVAPPVN